MKDLRKRENDLLRRVEQARATYDEGARAAASGDTATDLASVRGHIAILEGELSDIRAAIQSAKQLSHERATVAERQQRIELLKSTAALIERRRELAPQLVEQIEALGKTYRAFVAAGSKARTNALSADRSNRTYEGVDQALGVQQGVDQMLAGLCHLAGIGPVMKEAGAVWASTMRNGLSFEDIVFQRTERAATVVQHQIQQESLNVPTPLSAHRGPRSLAR